MPLVCVCVCVCVCIYIYLFIYVSSAGRLRFIQVLQVWMIGIPHSRYCKSFPQKIRFRYVQAQFKTGPAVFTRSTQRNISEKTWQHTNIAVTGSHLALLRPSVTVTPALFTPEKWNNKQHLLHKGSQTFPEMGRKVSTSGFEGQDDMVKWKIYIRSENINTNESIVLSVGVRMCWFCYV